MSVASTVPLKILSLSALDVAVAVFPASASQMSSPIASSSKVKLEDSPKKYNKFSPAKDSSPSKRPAGTQERGNSSSPAKRSKDFAELKAKDPLDDRPHHDPRLIPHGPSPRFGVLSDILDVIQEKQASKRRKPEITDKYILAIFANWRKDVGLDLYPLIRLLLPDKDRERNNYGLKENNLAKVYTKALNLDKDTSAAQRLRDWKNPTQGGKARAGDFASIAKEVIQERSGVTEHVLTIDEVNENLDRLAAASGEKDKGKVIAWFNERMTANEQRWLIGIILKDMKLSLGEKRVMKVLHPDAMGLFNVCSDLKRVCWTLFDAEITLTKDDTVIRCNRHFRPMFCKRNEKDLGDVIRLMHLNNPDQKFVIEEKLDGERIQLHKFGNNFRYWSRQGTDYTNLYGGNKYKGSLTPHIQEAFDSAISQIILDGEMLVYDPMMDKLCAFGTLKSAAKQNQEPTFSDGSAQRPCLRIFDILLVKGADGVVYNLAQYPLQKRKEALRTLVKPIKGYIEFAHAVEGASLDDIKREMDVVLQASGEGLVIKHPLTLYLPGQRNEAWIKLKPEYMDALWEDLDLIIVGAFLGEGRRGGMYGSFAVACLDDQLSTEDHKVYANVAKVGSGFKYTDYVNFYSGDEFKNLWTKFPARGQPDPSSLKFGAEKPDYYIDPAKSIVVTVKASSLVRDAVNYGAEVTLRFPRCTAIRTDKDIEDIETLTSVWERLTKRKQRLGATTTKLDGHLRRRVQKRKAVSSEASGDSQLPRSESQLKSRIFKGLTFLVMEDGPTATKKQLEILVATHGGEYRQVPPIEDNRRIIAHRLNFHRVRRLSEKGETIIRPEWVMDCVDARRKLPLLEEYVLHAGNVPIESEEDLDKTPEEDDSASPIDFIPDVPMRTYVSDSETDDDVPRAASHGSVKEENDESVGATRDVASMWSSRSFFASEAPEDTGQLTLAADEPETMHYDNEQIFKHLVFYIDTREAALANGLDVSPGSVSENEDDAREAATLLISRGAKLASNLDNVQIFTSERDYPN
ncbi:hypothetical protein E5Q_02090 [Mixia osmundae IAM 14324]|uniref:DNA ligase n=1 Tax=Mixia osmundae (strain CBS 9802 / IAM 14324 / JCM 22182 / KY 12970) TaxID=764103 RepID=G7DXX7_MIXOS|nr:hypothetical protein E5Q_02090 [Mixia osmundae IAM 14324]